MKTSTTCGVLFLLLGLNLLSACSDDKSQQTHNQATEMRVVQTTETPPSLAQDKGTECQYSDTTFIYNNQSYNVRDAIALMNHIHSCQKVGKYLAIDGHINPRVGGFVLFNTQTLEFEKSFVGNEFIFYQDDISTLVYIDNNQIYNYQEEVVATLPEDGLWALTFSPDGKEVLATDRENTHKTPLRFAFKR
ncbi:MAG: hypothetical protein IKI11_11070 [Neisseriaceae bacterium]|nr:hypothetical protein [Neisseriaceae bacterium]